MAYDHITRIESGNVDGRTYIWNTESLAWEAATKGSGVGEIVEVENFPAVISGSEVPISGSIDVNEETKSVRLVESGVYIYIGKAILGASESALVWQIKRVDESSGLSILWADGDDHYDNRWDQRESKDYS